MVLNFVKLASKGGREFKCRQGVLYCATCNNNLFKSKCEACREPITGKGKYMNK